MQTEAKAHASVLMQAAVDLDDLEQAHSDYIATAVSASAQPGGVRQQLITAALQATLDFINELSHARYLP